TPGAIATLLLWPINRGKQPGRQASTSPVHIAMRSLIPPEPRPAQRRLTEADAVDIWLARWLRIRRKYLLDRYGCDPRRLYEVWEGKRFPGSRQKALARLAELYPQFAGRIDPGPHRRVPRRPPTDLQGDLFDPGTGPNKL